MSKPVMITTDSTADLSAELQQRFDIRVIPLTITLGDESFPDGEKFTPCDMYARYQADGTLPELAPHRNSMPFSSTIQSTMLPVRPFRLELESIQVTSTT